MSLLVHKKFKIKALTYFFINYKHFYKFVKSNGINENNNFKIKYFPTENIVFSHEFFESFIDYNYFLGLVYIIIWVAD